MENSQHIFETLRRILPGLVVAIMITIPAYLLGNQYPVVGGPVLAIIFGVAASRAISPTFTKFLKPGLQFSGKYLLQVAIVLLGTGMSLAEIWVVGRQSVWVLFGTLAIALASGFILGRLAAVEWRLISLITVGTAICGASAIAAIAPVIAATAVETSYAISTIFTFNMLAVIIFPAMGHLLQLGDSAFGLWAGTAINDTSSVVAAAFSYSTAAGSYATVVKLARATMIIPITLGMAVYTTWRTEKPGFAEASAGRERFRLFAVIPWFIVFFLFAVILRSFGVFPDWAVPFGSEGGRWLILVALAAIGLNTDPKMVRKAGVRPLLLGMAVWLITAGSSLLIQWLQGGL